MKHLVMIKNDLNVYFKKGDVVEVLHIDEKSQLVYVYNKKNKKRQWLMMKDVM